MDLKIIMMVAWAVTVGVSLVNEKVRKKGFPFISITSAVIIVALVSVGEVAGMVAAWIFN